MCCWYKYIKNKYRYTKKTLDDIIKDNFPDLYQIINKKKYNEKVILMRIKESYHELANLKKK